VEAISSSPHSRPPPCVEMKIPRTRSEAGAGDTVEAVAGADTARGRRASRARVWRNRMTGFSHMKSLMGNQEKSLPIQVLVVIPSRD
jgi:hypothetical protein